MELQIGESRKRNKSGSVWLSFFYATLVLLALVWLSVVYLPKQFRDFRQEINQTVDEKLTSHTAEIKRRLKAIEEKVGQLGFLNDASVVQTIKEQENSLQTKLQSLESEIAIHQATIQNLTQTISDYESTIESLDLRKQELENQIENAQNQ